MSAVDISGLRKEFGDRRRRVVALEGIDLSVRAGEMLVLVGPSGCGKTTLLRCLAGLEHADAGTITIGADAVFDAERKVSLSPDRRDIGMVFQKYALWPHMTVLRNVEYPLRARRRKEALRAGRARQALETVRCEALGDRLPAQLSGGQQQRVALARAIASDPAVLLLDEPLSNLDALLRVELREELRILHQRLGFTGVYVTHDQSEALSLGDRVAVMRAGRIQQLATPRELFDRPATPEVAAFLGIRNRFEARLERGRWVTDSGPLDGFAPPDGAGEGPVEVFARPEHLELWTGPDTRPGGVWDLGEGLVEHALFAGATVEYMLRVGGQRVVAVAPRDRHGVAPGETVRVGVGAPHALVYAGGTLRSPARGTGEQGSGGQGSGEQREKVAVSASPQSR